MNRLFSCVLLTALFADAAAAQASRPNVLLLFADDQRVDTISAWDNPHIRTPNIDRLAERGFSFRGNYCMGGDSGAVCIPSRAMLNSGRAFFRLRHDLGGEKLLGELLGENGYTTFATGKWHNQEPSWLRSFQKGKAVMFGGMSDHTKVPIKDLSPEGKLVDPGPTRKFSSVLFADSVIEFLEGHKSDRPFYAYVAFTAPHDPRQPPMRYREEYYRNRPPLPANFLPQHPFQNGELTGRDESLGAWPRTTQLVSDQLAEYYGLVTHLDEQVGRVLKALEATGKADNTIVIYAADHGLAVGSHGLLGKQNVYEHSMRAPLIFMGPGVPRGKSSDSLTYLLDIYPTLCELTGVKPPSGLDGHSLAPIWRGQKTSVRETLLLAYKGLMRSVRNERWKLIRYPPINHVQLFDLVNDPQEVKNLAEEPRHKARIEQMTTQLREWQKKLGDDQALTVSNPEPKEIDLTGHERTPDRWQPQYLVEKYFPNWY